MPNIPALESLFPADLPLPTQASLEAKLTSIAMVQVFGRDTDQFGERVLLCTVQEPDALAALCGTLRIFDIIDPDKAFHCMCIGDERFDLYATTGELRISFTLHHGSSIRCEAWRSDARLQDGEQLLRWLNQQEVSAPLIRYRKAQMRHAENQRLDKLWQSCNPDMPAAFP